MASYKVLNIIQSYTPFIESDKVPSDAEVTQIYMEVVSIETVALINGSKITASIQFVNTEISLLAKATTCLSV